MTINSLVDVIAAESGFAVYPEDGLPVVHERYLQHSPCSAQGCAQWPHVPDGAQAPQTCSLASGVLKYPFARRASSVQKNSPCASSCSFSSRSYRSPATLPKQL